MKEVFTKSFWEGVKRTFDEARDGPPPANTASQIPAGEDLQASLTIDSGTDLARDSESDRARQPLQKPK